MQHSDIVIVENEKEIALDLKRIIKPLGFRSIRIAYDAQKALQIAQNGNIDLLVTDVNLGHGMSGVTLAQKLQKCCRTACVFITASRDEAILKKVARIDHASYIVKPFRDEEVEALLKIAVLRLPPKSKLPLPWHYNETTYTLYRDDAPFTLTPKEKLLFHLLYRAGGTIVAYRHIEAMLWPEKTVSNNTRRQFFHRFKKRLEGLEISVAKGEGLRLSVV